MAKLRSSRVLLGFLVCAAIVGLGLAIAQDQETLKLKSPIAADDPTAPAYISAIVGAALTDGNQYDVLTNGDQIYPAMLAAIDGAQQRISLETYIYEKGQVAEMFTAALERAAKRGVKVNIVVDNFGAAGMEDEDIERLTSAGCTVLTLNAPGWFEIEELNYRTHRKILVVDGKVGFTGGVGFADYWLGNAQSKDNWRDTHVRIRGPVVRYLEGAFYENFIEGSLEPVAPELEPAPSVPGTDGLSFIIRGASTGGANDLKRLYLLSFAMARRSVDITSPYFVHDESTLWSFEDAIRRGVRIRLLVEGDVTDAKPVKYSSRAIYERLLGMGVEIHEYQPTMLHAKVLVVDGTWSMFGSANFDNRSLELNDELNVVVASRNLAARFLEDFEQDLRAARRLELAEWQQRPQIEKVREKFWSYFGEVF